MEPPLSGSFVIRGQGYLIPAREQDRHSSFHSRDHGGVLFSVALATPYT